MTILEFRTMLERAPAEIARQVDALLRDEAAAAAADAKRRAPRRTGELAGSIVGKVLQDQQIALSAAAPYAAIQEYGGTVYGHPRLTFQLPGGGWRSAKQVRIPAHPYLRPALAAAEDRVVAELERLVVEVLDGR